MSAVWISVAFAPSEIAMQVPQPPPAVTVTAALTARPHDPTPSCTMRAADVSSRGAADVRAGTWISIWSPGVTVCGRITRRQTRDPRDRRPCHVNASSYAVSRHVPALARQGSSLRARSFRRDRPASYSLTDLHSATSWSRIASSVIHSALHWYQTLPS